MPVALSHGLAIELLPPADLRPLPGVPRPPAWRLKALAASVKARGVLYPLLVRPAVGRLLVQEGRLRGVRGYFVLDPRLGRAGSYRADPPFFADRPAAERSLPAAVPWEVVVGIGRLAAARAARLEYVPCVLADLTDEDVAELRRGDWRS